MKDFSDFCKFLTESEVWIQKQSESISTLSEDQVKDVYRLMMHLLREYHEWHQQ